MGDSDDNTLPVVMIAGAGLGGLLLAVIFERNGIPYKIFERATKLKPLGSTFGFGCNILPVFEQLGLLEDMMRVSYPTYSIDMYDSHLNPVGGFSFKHYKKKTGYDTIMFPRPALHNLLLSRVPPHKILLGKKVMSLLQNKEGVMIRCSDNTTYHGDILIGADGAYSGVRQSLYKAAIRNNDLPLCDRDGLNTGHICMVGTTNSLDPAKYPVVNDNFAHFKRIINEGTPFSWSVVTMPEKQICWMAVVQLDPSKAKNATFMNSEWGPESNASMIKQIYNFPCPVGGTMGDLIDATPPDLISKVFLEDRLFETWTYGRTALIGDAAHKFLPSAGQGAVNAMEDAVIVANCIHDIEKPTYKNIMAALKDYYRQRYPHVKYQMAKSRTMAKLLYGQTWQERLTRRLIFNWVPKSIQTKQLFKDASYRPQIMFLPQVKNRGTVAVLPQKPSKKYQQEQGA
ncbi:hypothetical protein BG003_006703 [Podila horticola]|nr:hypothetical protein BG003_006703 [Podila horticola]